MGRLRRQVADLRELITREIYVDGLPVIRFIRFLLRFMQCSEFEGDLHWKQPIR